MVKRNFKNDSWGDKKQSLTAVVKRNRILQHQFNKIQNGSSREKSQNTTRAEKINPI
jgi:hypothetical protein